MLGFNRDKEGSTEEVEQLRKDIESLKAERLKLQERNEAIERRLRVSESQRISLANDKTRLEAAKVWSEGALRRARNEEIRAKRAMAELSLARQEDKLAIGELKAALAHRTEDIEGLQSQLLHAPAANAALTTLARAQADLLELIQASITCPMCFEYITKGEVISLACGHTFCQPCIDQWSNASVSNQMRLAAERQTKMIAPECPECRGDASRKGRVKVYMLEDVVRAVQRWDEQSVREQMRLAASNIEKPPETSDNLPQELDHSDAEQGLFHAEVS